MDLSDLKKLESVPEESLFMLGYFGCENMDKVQIFCEQAGFDFSVPKHEKCDQIFDIWPNDEKMYLYLVMKELYGSPATLKIGSNTFIAYVLTSGRSLFGVPIAVNGSGEVINCYLTAVGEKGVLHEQVAQLKKALRRKISQLKNSQQRVSDSVQRTYFENPFHFYFQQGQRQLDVISKHNKQAFDKSDIEHGIYKLKEELKLFELDDSNRDEARKVKTKRNIKGLEVELDDLELYWGTLDDRLYETAAFFLFVASFEGFLNLFYEIYLRQESRENEQIKKKIRLSSIKDKLRKMPTYCNCFKDEDRLIELDETFNKIRAIFDLRNDLIHANMTSAMKVELYDIPLNDLEKMTFYVHENKNQNKYDLPHTAGSLTVENLRFISETIEKMVEKIMTYMKPENKREFKQVLHQDGFYARLVDGEYVIEVDKI